MNGMIGSTGFWMGHRMLGDVIGFCAAAHLYATKIGQPVKVWFDPLRTDACDYFDGIRWVPKEHIPGAVDCGGTPTADEWPDLNGVKRFYRYMDATMQPTKSFDIHFNRAQKGNSSGDSERLIGLITHGNTHGDIDHQTVLAMLDEARMLYPDHRVVCFGCMDNVDVPPGVEDWRQPSCDISWIIEFVAKLSLLISPHSGPCFIAAGWRVPTWVLRSRVSCWDWALNYDSYQVQRWWDRPVECPFGIFDEIYRRGGWNGMGSGPGSRPEWNREYIELLNQLIARTSGIKTVLDIGCGDWQIMRHVNLAGKSYLGIDVSPHTIGVNNRTFATEHVRFQVMNACQEPLPAADLIIIKDVLQHLPNAYVQALLAQVAQRCRWAVIVNDHAEENAGQDIPVGGWRPINILAPPFCFPGITLALWHGKHVALSCCAK